MYTSVVDGCGDPAPDSGGIDAPHHGGDHRPPTFDAPEARPTSRPLLGLRSAHGVRAWMLVPPIDAIMLLLPLLWMPEHAKAVLLMAAVSLVLLHGTELFRARLHLSVLDTLPALLGRLLAAGGVVGMTFALVHEQTELGSFLGSIAATIGLVVLGRIVSTQVILLARRRRIVAYRTVIVGGGRLATELAMLLKGHAQYGLALAGVVDNAPHSLAAGVTSHLGRVEDLPTLVREHGIDVIIVADGGDAAESALLEAIRRTERLDADLLVVPRMSQFHMQVGSLDHVGSITVMRVRTPSLSGPAWAVKRAMDLVVATTALIVLAPVLLACALAVRLEGGPGILFRQERVGRDGKIFYCLKFRTMRPASATEAATQWSIAQDDRVGPVGRLLRRTSFDELPQLWSIVRGDMTLVGPRPERPHFVEKFSAEVEGYHHRHRVRAGLTGLAQVSGLRGDTPIHDRARVDNFYIENWSLWLDAKVLLRTFGEIFFARGR